MGSISASPKPNRRSEGMHPAVHVEVITSLDAVVPVFDAGAEIDRDQQLAAVTLGHQAGDEAG